MKNARSLKKQIRRSAKINAKLSRKKGSSTESVPRLTSSPFRLVTDAWENIVTGLGMQNRDKRLGAKMVIPKSTSEFQFYEDIYHGDDLGRTVVDVPSQEMVREWITVQHDDDDKENDADDERGNFSGDQSQSQLGFTGKDQLAQQSKDLDLASKNIAPADTKPIEQPPAKTTGQEARNDDLPPPSVLNQPVKPSALPLHPGPDDSAETEIEDEDAAEKKLIGKKTLQKLEAMEAQTKVFEALVWSKVFGGSIVFLGINDGIGDDPTGLSKPLDEEKIESFDFLSVFDRWDVDVYSWYRNPTHPKFGLPESYRIRQTASAGGTDSSLSGDIIHESRVIRFNGEMVNRRRRLRNAGWDDSLYIRVADVIRDFSVAWGGVANLLQDFSQAIFKMKGLANAMLADNDELVLKRMKMMDMVRSVSRAVPLDMDSEEFERKETPTSGMPELLDRFALRLAAAVRMPVTLLMGQSPAGLNATGDADIRFFYDYIKSQQERILRPRLNRIIYLLFKSKNGPTSGEIPENWSIKFNPLWQETQSQQATMRLATAQADQIYFNMGSLTADEIAQSRFGGDAYSVETVLDTEQRKADKALQAKMNAAMPEMGNPMDPNNPQKPGDPTENPADQMEEPEQPGASNAGESTRQDGGPGSGPRPGQHEEKLKAITDKILKKEGWKEPKDVNCGMCEDWARDAQKEIGGNLVTLTWEGNVVPHDAEGGDHVVLEKDGQYFDSEHPTGVSSPKDLNFVKRSLRIGGPWGEGG